MLRFLSIERLAVIDALEVEFAPGLNVVTGETGAGKSIVGEGVELPLGGRASADLVRTGEDHARVQAVLETPDGREVIVRREVSASGRSRAFVDGALVASGALRDVTGPLIDLHGQHEHQELLATTAHLALLDRYAGLEAPRLQVSSAFDDMQRARTSLESSQLDDRERTARLDLLRFQLGEIDRIGPKLGEDELLEAERHVLANADRVMRLASEAYDALYEGDAAALARLAVVWRKLDDLASLDPRFAPFLAQRDPVQLPLTDLALIERALGSSSLIPALGPPTISAVIATLAPGADGATVLSNLSAWSDVSVYTTEEQRQLMLKGTVEMARRQIGLFTAPLTFISAIIMALILYTLTLEKLHEIALLKLIGAPNRVILSMILKQDLFLAAVGYGVAYLLGQRIFPKFPRRVILLTDDLLTLAAIVFIISVLASVLGVSSA